jgi:hypothetical protein
MFLSEIAGPNALGLTLDGIATLKRGPLVERSMNRAGHNHRDHSPFPRGRAKSSITLQPILYYFG